MKSMQFNGTLTWAKEQGLFINERLERKCVNGVCGMFARDDIDENVVLASYPVSKLIGSLDIYPQNTSISAKQIHSAAKEYCRKDDSDYGNFFNFFDSLDYLHKYSTFFINEKELRIINEVNPLLSREIAHQNYLNQSLINALYDFDPSISKENYTLITLNYNSRAIGKNGFVPIIECFNHSNEKGEFIHTDNDRVVLKTKIKYTKGEQVYISYGALDLYTHAINYNYYASGTDHYIQFHKRFFFPLLTNRDQAIARELSQAFKVAIQEINGLRVFSVEDKEAFLNEEKPSKKAMQIATILAQGRDPNSFLSSYLQQSLSQNNVSKFSEKYFPTRLKRFYWVLLKEQEMLSNNIDYLNA